MQQKDITWPLENIVLILGFGEEVFGDDHFGALAVQTARKGPVQRFVVSPAKSLIFCLTFIFEDNVILREKRIS